MDAEVAAPSHETEAPAVGGDVGKKDAAGKREGTDHLSEAPTSSCTSSDSERPKKKPKLPQGDRQSSRVPKLEVSRQQEEHARRLQELLSQGGPAANVAMARHAASLATPADPNPNSQAHHTQNHPFSQVQTTNPEQPLTASGACMDPALPHSLPPRNPTTSSSTTTTISTSSSSNTDSSSSFNSSDSDDERDIHLERHLTPEAVASEKTKICGMPELYCILDFLYTFRRQLALQTMLTLDTLAEALVSSPGPGMLAELHYELLKTMVVTSKLTLDHWQPYLCLRLRNLWSGLSRVHGPSPFHAKRGQEARAYAALPAVQRVLALKALCDLRCEREDIADAVADAISGATKSSAKSIGEVKGRGQGQAPSKKLAPPPPVPPPKGRPNRSSASAPIPTTASVPSGGQRGAAGKQIAPSLPIESLMKEPLGKDHLRRTYWWFDWHEDGGKEGGLMYGSVLVREGPPQAEDHPTSTPATQQKLQEEAVQQGVKEETVQQGVKEETGSREVVSEPATKEEELIKEAKVETLQPEVPAEERRGSSRKSTKAATAASKAGSGKSERAKGRKSGKGGGVREEGSSLKAEEGDGKKGGSQGETKGKRATVKEVGGKENGKEGKQEQGAGNQKRTAKSGKQKKGKKGEPEKRFYMTYSLPPHLVGGPWEPLGSSIPELEEVAASLLASGQSADKQMAEQIQGVLVAVLQERIDTEERLRRGRERAAKLLGTRLGGVVLSGGRTRKAVCYTGMSNHEEDSESEKEKKSKVVPPPVPQRQRNPSSELLALDMNAPASLRTMVVKRQEAEAEALAAAKRQKEKDWKKARKQEKQRQRELEQGRESGEKGSDENVEAGAEACKEGGEGELGGCMEGIMVEVPVLAGGRGAEIDRGVVEKVGTQLEIPAGQVVGQ